uniref:Uncharacterized protein n=1 Tax=Ditylenchus dipsaci TaxID=166011 RepID=A0A915DHF3_9BILA
MITKFYILRLPDRENIPTMFSTFDIFAGGCSRHKQIVIPLLIWSKKDVPQSLKAGGVAFAEVPRYPNGGLDSAFFRDLLLVSTLNMYIVSQLLKKNSYSGVHWD